MDMTKRLTSRIFVFIAAAMLATGASRPGEAQQRIIRDAEIEDTIALYAAPLLRAASLDPAAVRFHIIDDTALNAFVAGGQHVFVTTGLLRKAATPLQVMGVLAHELGHVAGGHLARMQGAARDASYQALAAALLGVAVGVLTRSGQAAAAIGVGGQQIVETSLLSYSRAQENAADQAGMSFLDRSGLSARGLLEFLEVIEDQELLVASRRDAYASTHPLTRERIDAVRHHVETSRYSDHQIPAALAERQARMVAKLKGFLDPTALTLRAYKPDDKSVAARYARAIAYYRIPEMANALELIDGLIGEAPNDPFFHELKGQMLFENGRIEDALAPYRTAVRLLPASPLLRTELAHALVETNTPDANREAIANLGEALRKDRRNPGTWRLAGIAYGRDGQEGESALALAEYNMAIGRFDDAVRMAERAKRAFPEGAPGRLRAEDISKQAKRRAERK